MMVGHVSWSPSVEGRMLSPKSTTHGLRRYRALDPEGHEWCFAMKSDAS